MPARGQEEERYATGTCPGPTSSAGRDRSSRRSRPLYSQPCPGRQATPVPPCHRQGGGRHFAPPIGWPVVTSATKDPKRVLAGRRGAHIQHSRHSAFETTRAARDSFLAGFERQVDPSNVLDPQERARRAHHLKSAYFSRLALLSVRSRQRRNGGE